jgi:hypothetical protein
MGSVHGPDATDVIEFASQNTKHLDGDLQGRLGFQHPAVPPLVGNGDEGPEGGEGGQRTPIMPSSRSMPVWSVATWPKYSPLQLPGQAA